MSVRLWVGLGNPGAKYAGNRHNVGFMALERIAADHGGAPWRAKFQGEVSEARFGSDRVVLLRPGTFMNLSGQSVGEAMRFHKLDPADVTVWHDELDLAPFKLRLKSGGGHAGHNGLRSIHQHIGDAYDRVRVGIGHPGHKDKVAGYVLSDFAKAEAGGLDDLLRGVSDGAPKLAAGDGPAFLNAVAQRTAPPRGAKPAKPARPPADGGGETSPPASDGAEVKLSPLQRLASRFR